MISFIIKQNVCFSSLCFAKVLMMSNISSENESEPDLIENEDGLAFDR